MAKPKHPLIFLHGFLGSPQEFSPVIQHLQGQPIFLPSLYDRGPLDPTHSLRDWTRNFKAWIRDKNKPWVIGYSMGGRLALHAAALLPDEIAGVVAISAHPGLNGAEEKQQRVLWESQWIRRFQELPLADTIRLWQAQDIFAQSEKAVVDPYLESELIRSSLDNWSTARHEFQPCELLEGRCPLHWVVGRRDTKYCELLSRFLRGRPEDLTVIENAAHRVHLDAPEALASVLNRLTI